MRIRSLLAVVFAAALSQAAFAQTTLHLQSLEPSSGPVGTEIVLHGEGFTAVNAVSFGTGMEPYVFSDDGSTLRITVPAGLTPASGNPSPGRAHTNFQVVVFPGAYNVKVNNANGTSEELTFTVTGQSLTPPCFNPSGCER